MDIRLNNYLGLEYTTKGLELEFRPLSRMARRCTLTKDNCSDTYNTRLFKFLPYTLNGDNGTFFLNFKVIEDDTKALKNFTFRRVRLNFLLEFFIHWTVKNDILYSFVFFVGRIGRIDLSGRY